MRTIYYGGREFKIMTNEERAAMKAKKAAEKAKKAAEAVRKKVGAIKDSRLVTKREITSIMSGSFSVSCPKSLFDSPIHLVNKIETVKKNTKK